MLSKLFGLGRERLSIFEFWATNPATLKTTRFRDPSPRITAEIRIVEDTVLEVLGRRGREWILVKPRRACSYNPRAYVHISSIELWARETSRTETRKVDLEELIRRGKIKELDLISCQSVPILSTPVPESSDPYAQSLHRRDTEKASKREMIETEELLDTILDDARHTLPEFSPSSSGYSSQTAVSLSDRTTKSNVNKKKKPVEYDAVQTDGAITLPKGRLIYARIDTVVQEPTRGRLVGIVALYLSSHPPSNVNASPVSNCHRLSLRRSLQDFMDFHNELTIILPGSLTAWSLRQLALKFMAAQTITLDDQRKNLIEYLGSLCQLENTGALRSDTIRRFFSPRPDDSHDMDRSLTHADNALASTIDSGIPRNLRDNSNERSQEAVERNQSLELVYLKADELSTLRGEDAAKWADMFYTRRQSGIEDEALIVHMTRILFKLILAAGRFPHSMVLKNVIREIDDRGRICDLVFQGGFGDVYRGTHGTHTVALKALRPLVTDAMKRRQAFVKEILTLSDLHHPFVVLFLGVCEEVVGLGSTPCIVFPWYKHGSLEHFLESKSHDENGLLAWVRELLQGLEYLHTRSVPVIHGDIRAGNILIDDEEHIRIADFGLSQLEHFTRTMTTTIGAGTLQWKAPEMFPVEDVYNEDDSDADHRMSAVSGHRHSTLFKSLKSKATDTWALGCTIYEVYEGKYPYHYICRGNQVHDWRILNALRKGMPPASSRPKKAQRSRTTMPAELWDVVDSCWDREPSRRPDIHSLFQRLG